MVNSQVAVRGHNPHKDAKDTRKERHSAGAKGSQAYGDTGNKHGAGKFNWGNAEQDDTSNALNDPNDPLYDSDSQENDENDGQAGKGKKC